MNLIIIEKREKHVQITEPLYKLSSFFFRGSRPACEVAQRSSIIELLWGKNILFKVFAQS